ncbi:MAG: hypothetical protein SFY66_04415 [Oculatellaceae cyanobacterium bins.114]|nr:hypothetical protein [Oculatellaceae cyanobacterium bins.114]
MSQNLGPISPLQPLNIGNVVSAGVVLYRSHLKSYLGVALQGALWSFLPFLVLIPLGAVLYGSFAVGGSPPAILWLLVPVWIVLLFFCGAKYLLYSALLARLTFKDLDSQPETVRDARQRLNTRLWSFFGLAVLLSILMFVVYFGLAMAVGILSTAIALGLSGILGQTASTALAFILAGVVVIVGLTWFFSRWFVSEVVLAVEDGIDVGRSLSRSWELTEASVLRIQGVILVAFLITLPLLALTNYIPSFALTRIEPASPTYFVVYGISLIASFLSWILILPFWQSVKSVLYYDLRNRREGLGLQLRDS